MIPAPITPPCTNTIRRVESMFFLPQVGRLDPFVLIYFTTVGVPFMV
jgi:hypothetical protein